MNNAQISYKNIFGPNLNYTISNKTIILTISFKEDKIMRMHRWNHDFIFKGKWIFFEFPVRNIWQKNSN